MENNIIKPAKKWYRKKRWWLVAAAVAGIAVWAVFFRGGEKITYEIITVKKGDLVQEVSVTGKIKPVQAVDLQFESAGRISSINYKVGDKVNSGAVIASLENQDLQAAVTSAKADLEKTIRNFNSLSDPAISSSLRVELENAQANIVQVKLKADGDLASDYNSAFNAMREAMTQLDTSSVVLEYLRKTYLEAKQPWDEAVKRYQASVDFKVDRVHAVFPDINSTGTVITPSLYAQMDLALSEILNACSSLRGAFTYLQGEVQNNSYLISSTTDRSSLNSEAAAISSDLSAVSTAIQNIADQKITNNKNISDAESALASAEAAFPTSEDILQKQAALLSAQSQLRKSLITAPFTGTVGKIDIELGQTVNSSTIAVSLISVAKYQIESNITEVDIGKVMVGNPAVLSLDAYGSQVTFNAKVSAIDTTATIVEGVTTYKTVFDFDGPIDPGIRPNMTANLDIQTAKKENVISVPQRAIISRNGNKFVRIFRGDNIPFDEKEVKTGMSGKDGLIEITEGLSEGEQVITFINN